MSTLGSTAALQAGVESVTRQSGGAVEIVVVMQAEIPEVVGAALAGEPGAVQIFQLTIQTLHRIETAPKRDPLLCATCPQALRSDGRFSLVMAIPACDSPVQALGLAVCGKCATEPVAVQAKGVAALRNIWPDLRTANITHPQGCRA